MEAHSEERIDWHTAFYDALRLTLEGYHDKLRFIFEHQLTAEPLRVDALIEKEPGAVIDQEIGRLFRRWNLLEYKSPDDSLTIRDFRKVRAYGELYGSQNGVDSLDMTMSFVVSRYPRELIKRLEELYGYRVRKEYEGIYYISGYEIPMQVVVTKRLNEREHLWLKHLSNRLTLEGMQKVMEASETKPRGYIKAYIQMICRANPDILAEVIAMQKLRVEKIFEEAGWTAKWEERGRAEKALEIARNLMRKGWQAEEIAETAELDLALVKALYTEPQY